MRIYKECEKTKKEAMPYLFALKILNVGIGVYVGFRDAKGIPLDLEDKTILLSAPAIISGGNATIFGHFMRKRIREASTNPQHEINATLQQIAETDEELRELQSRSTEFAIGKTYHKTIAQTVVHTALNTGIGYCVGYTLGKM